MKFKTYTTEIDGRPVHECCTPGLSADQRNAHMLRILRELAEAGFQKPLSIGLRRDGRLVNTWSGRTLDKWWAEAIKQIEMDKIAKSANS